MKVFYIDFEGFGYHGGTCCVLATDENEAADILQRHRMKEYIDGGHTEEEILRSGKITKIREVTSG